MNFKIIILVSIHVKSDTQIQLIIKQDKMFAVNNSNEKTISSYFHRFEKKMSKNRIILLYHIST